MPEEPSRCPACGASVDGDTAFCHACDSLVSSPTERHVRSSPRLPTVEARAVASDRERPRVPVVPATAIDCWSCDTPNSPSRMFCVSCGSFIAIGSGTRPPSASAPFSGPPPVPGDADVDVSLPFVEGVSPLGSYALEAQRRATRRTRTMTAVASVVLAAVIGGAALYLASPLGQGGGDAPQTAVVVPSEAPGVSEQTRGVSGVTIGPDAAAEPRAAQPDPLAAEPQPEDKAEPARADPQAADPQPAESEPEPVEPVAQPDPVAEPEPVEAVAQPDPVAEPEPVEPVAQPDPVAEPEPVVPEVRSAYDGGWVCGQEVVIEDTGDRAWSISHVSFRVRDGFERVVLHLDRVGQGSGAPTTLTAGSMRNDKVRTSIPGVRAPGLGRRSVTLQLQDGFSGMRGLNAYRPSGVGIIKEFSLYPVGRDGRSVVISADTDGCYRVRVPGWNDPSGSLRRAEIHVDIKP